MTRKTVDQTPNSAIMSDMSTLPLDETLSVAETATALRRAESLIKRLIYRGDLQAVKLGRDWRVAKASVANFTPKAVGNPNFAKRS